MTLGGNQKIILLLASDISISYSLIVRQPRSFTAMHSLSTNGLDRLRIRLRKLWIGELSIKAVFN